MKILLLSQNHTVTNIITLSMDNLKNVEFDVAEAMEHVNKRSYDWLFVNDTFPIYQEALTLATKLGNPQTVILHQPNNVLIEGFDHKIPKPFLPAEVQELLQNKSKIKKLSGKDKKEHNSSEILNIDEIETIKALLEEDGLEIVHEEELVETVLSESSVDYEQQKSKKDKATKELDKELLKVIKQMKPKKIRKLLKGAEVTLHINFPKEL